MIYSKGEVYRINLIDNYHTFVIIVGHIRPGMLGYRSLLAKEGGPTIPIDVLERSNHSFVCRENDSKYLQVIEEMEKDLAVHMDLWLSAHPEAHYNADMATLSLIDDGCSFVQQD